LSLSIELERDESLTVRQWEDFLGHARRAGASDDTSVTEVMCAGTDVLNSYRVEISEERRTGPGPEHVTLPTWLVYDLLSVVTEVAKSDGDVRGLESGAQTALQRTYDYLLRPVLGESPYSSEPTEDPKAE
jgi:hypothetical protein